jgi:hypothetical protein
MQAQVNHPKYRHFFVIHELETWLLSDTSVLNRSVHEELAKKLKNKAPETVNDKKPPAKLLDEIFFATTGHNYEDKKPETCANAFRRLDPKKAYAACPSLKAILDEMYEMAVAAGVEPV